MSKKMDDARRASRDRDVTKTEVDPDTHSRRARTVRGRWPECTECPKDSFSILLWNPVRQLWEHQCGFTATQQEVEEGLV